MKTLFIEEDVAFLVADWTNKNDTIAQELARHGRSGIPLYLIYPAGDKIVTPDILPPTLTKSVVREAIERAKG